MHRSQSSPPSERVNAQSGGMKSAAIPTAPQQSEPIDVSYPRPLGAPGDVPRAGDPLPPLNVVTLDLVGGTIQHAAPEGVGRLALNHDDGARYELTTAGRAELAGPEVPECWPARATDPCADCGHELGPVYYELIEPDGYVRRDGYRCADCHAAHELAPLDSLSGHVNNAAQIITLTRNLGHELTSQELGALRRRLRAALYLLDGAR
jgi:hypothetical protein